MLKAISKTFNIIYPFPDFLYILQLEEYDSKRYFNTIIRFIWRRNLQKRGRLIYTGRIKLTLFLALPCSLITPPLTPFWVGITNIILNPYFSIVKDIIQKRAANHFAKKNTRTKVIAIAGSFGKTTTKNYVYELIRFNYKTQIIPGNINTPAGIATWLLKNFDPLAEILIVEVDTYFIGEIRKSLAITPPDISILTNVGDQHLERLGTKKNLKKALNEVFEYAKPGAIFISNKKTSMDYALEVARILKIPKDIVQDTVKKFTPPDRRRKLTKINNFDMIDDSYNISETTAKSSIEYAKKLSNKAKKDLIIITAGIPELGEENKDGNINLGHLLDKKASVIILLKSILHTEVEKGIENKNKIIYAESMNGAVNKLKRFDPKKYLVLMQPELNDLYY